MNLAGEPGGSDSAAIILSNDCRSLRRILRPLVWVTLEEVAMETVIEDGRLLARTSARQIAERLGIDPGTAAAALGDLRKRGLVSSFREAGPSGRFGLSIYELGAVAGLTVVSPCAAVPCVARPSVAKPGQESPCLVSPWAETRAAAEPAGDRSDHDPAAMPEPDTSPSLLASSHGHGTTPSAGSVCRPARRTAPGRETSGPLEFPGQGAFDFGSGSS